jgi:two-component system aerobic respiration control protein ArcA
MPHTSPTGHSAARVIVVEDSPGLLEDLVYQLRHGGFDVRGAADGRQLDALLQQQDCDILLLDANLPFESGFEIARRLRTTGRRGVIMLTARQGLEDKLQGLDDGADLYLVKPIDRRELIGCINSLYRRIKPEETPLGGWRLNLGSRLLTAPDGRELELTPQEARTLNLLLSQPGVIFHRTDVLKTLGIDFAGVPDSRINMVMSRLRLKLITFDDSLRIKTWRNAGYNFVGPAFELPKTSEQRAS